MRAVEHIASDRWEIKAFAESCSTGIYSSRVLAAYSGLLANVVTTNLARLLNPVAWRALRPLGCSISNSCFAFACIFSTECALHQLILRQLAGFPWKLFALITDPSEALAREIRDAPKCMLDEFTRMFLRRFSSVEALLSKRCRAILTALAVFIRFEICRIECRHSYLRKFAFASSSWKPTLESISSRYLLLRSRLMEFFFDNVADPGSRVASDGDAKPPRVRRRGVFTQHLMYANMITLLRGLMFANMTVFFGGPFFC